MQSNRKQTSFAERRSRGDQIGRQTLANPDRLTMCCRSPELRCLLDGDSAFPCSPFDNEAVLAALQQLGLQTSAGFHTLLESARHIEQLSALDEAAAVVK